MAFLLRPTTKRRATTELKNIWKNRKATLKRVAFLLRPTTKRKATRQIQNIWKKAKATHREWPFCFVVARTGIEPVFRPWKGRVLTPRRTGHFCFTSFEVLSPNSFTEAPRRRWRRTGHFCFTSFEVLSPNSFTEAPRRRWRRTGQINFRAYFNTPKLNWSAKLANYS